LKTRKKGPAGRSRSAEEWPLFELKKYLSELRSWNAYGKARELYRLNSDPTASDVGKNIQAFMNMEEQCLPKYVKPKGFFSGSWMKLRGACNLLKRLAASYDF